MEQLKRIWQLMLPILITMLTIGGMQATDVIMTGHAGNVEVAGVSVASNVWFPLFTGFNGIIVASMTIFSNLLGAGGKGEIAPVLRHSLYLGVGIGGVLILAINFAINRVYLFVPVEPEVLAVSVAYIRALSWGVIPIFVVSGLRQFIESLNDARVVTITMICGWPINIFLNYLLIFGNWGAPKLGGAGAGYATAMSWTFICSVLLVVCTKCQPFAGYRIWQRIPFSWDHLQEQIRLGFPIGITIFFEVAMFNALGMLIVKFGTAAIAANQAVISLSSLFYMFILSLSIALNIVIGYAIGGEDFQEARRLAGMGLKISLTITMCSMVLLWLGQSFIARLYNSDPQAQGLIKQFIIYIMIYQVADGIAVSSQGIMRAYRDVRASFYITTFSYWGIALPMGLLFDRVLNRGITSYWQGMVVGIICGAAASYWRVRHLQNRCSS